MTTTTRRALLVLGMHRSGTSALTGVLTRLGATPPRSPMEATSDNPNGYGESRQIARFNNRLLESAGSRWNDDGRVSEEWLRSGERSADSAEAKTLLQEQFGESSLLVLKDPRMCRLLPFWRQVLEECEIEARGVLMIRDPFEVAASLAARAAVKEFRPAAIQAASRGVLLWLRYVLDSERGSREMERWVIDYAALMHQWRATCQPLFHSGWLPEPTTAVAAEIEAFLNPNLRHQRSNFALPEGISAATRALLQSVMGWLRDADPSQGSHLDQLSAALDRLTLAYASLRQDPDGLAERDLWSERILEALASRPATVRPRQAQPRVVFLSGSPRSIGHIYRVVHPATAMEREGWRTLIAAVHDPVALEAIEQADMVVVFRAKWDGWLETVRQRCTCRGIPLACDMDDLLFDPAVTAAGHIAYLDSLTEEARQQWISETDLYLQVLACSDAAVLSTQPLARAAESACARVFVLANALDPAMEEAAEAAMAMGTSSQRDGTTRFLFASGTPSHHRDLAIAARGMARVFARHPSPRLVILGHFDPRSCGDLQPLADRIDWWPAVPFQQLLATVARCDVNLCPLETANPFCESKSAVRWLTAACVGLPSIVSPSEPLREAVVAGVTGLLACGVDDWEQALEVLLEDATGRKAMGQAARVDALGRFGFDAWAPRAMEVYGTILKGGA
jgi:hypothetical protein